MPLRLFACLILILGVSIAAAGTVGACDNQGSEQQIKSSAPDGTDVVCIGGYIDPRGVR